MERDGVQFKSALRTELFKVARKQQAVNPNQVAH